MRIPEREYTEAGRWKGRLTNKPIPDHDPTIDALSAADREKLATIWHHRAAMERRVGDAFDVIREALVRLRAPETLVSLATRAIDDEYRHTELSRLVASRFAGRALPMPERLHLEVPKHKGASPELRDTLFVVGQCVLNETTASAFLECCVKHATGPVAVAALRELLSDEIDHGRIGWSHLASLDQAKRNEVARWMFPMAYLNLQIWKKETPYDPSHSEALSRHGSPSAEVTHAALVGALEDLIVPGMKELEMNTASIEAWLAAGANTDRAPIEFLSI